MTAKPEVQRFVHGTLGMWDAPRGEYVLHTAYAQLAQERDELRARVAGLDSALDVCQSALMEVAHAQRNGAEWYTRGERGLYAQVSMWVTRGFDAIKALRPAGGEG